MSVKEKLVEITTQLIKEKNGNPELVTVREIAKRAEVGIGLINYHFQSKENLISVCVKKIISSVIVGAKLVENSSPSERLKEAVKLPVDFVMQNQEISRVSVIDDLTNGHPNDNSFETLEKYLFHVRNLRLNDDDYFRTVFLLHGIQGIFLRWELYKNQFDFSDKTTRDKMLDGLVERIFGGARE